MTVLGDESTLTCVVRLEAADGALGRQPLAVDIGADRSTDSASAVYSPRWRYRCICDLSGGTLGDERSTVRIRITRTRLPMLKAGSTLIHRPGQGLSLAGVTCLLSSPMHRLLAGTPGSP